MEPTLEVEIVSDNAPDGLRRDTRSELPMSNALALIGAGHAWPVERPASCPQELLTWLQTCVSHVRKLGHSITSPKQLTAIEEHILRNGVRQAVVGGQPLRWVRGKGGLRELVGRRLNNSEANVFEPFGLFRFLALESVERWTFDSSGFRAQLYGHEYSRRRAQDCNDLNYVLEGIPSGWSDEDTLKALNLQADLEDTMRSALASGRILVSQEARAGDRLIHPEEAGATRIEDFDDTYWFVPMADVAACMKEALFPLEWRRKQATRLARDIVQHFENSGRMPTAKQIKRFLQDECNLKANAANDAWSQAKVHGVEFKNPKRNERVSDEEIAAVISIWRKK